jgi:hypothetical protein
MERTLLFNFPASLRDVRNWQHLGDVAILANVHFARRVIREPVAHLPTQIVIEGTTPCPQRRLAIRERLEQATYGLGNRLLYPAECRRFLPACVEQADTVGSDNSSATH